MHVLPSCEIALLRDAYGLKHYGTIEGAHAGFSLQAEGFVLVHNQQPEEAAPLWQLGPFRRMTALTQAGAALTQLSRQCAGSHLPENIMELLAERFTYLPGSTHAATTAEEAAQCLQGVCQDEAHIMLSLLRLQGIPCRYVMGYMLGEGSTHAWVEVYRDGFWVGYDPTNHRMVNDEYICIGAGRDANDCPVNRGVFCGNALQQTQSRLSVWAITERRKPMIEIVTQVGLPVDEQLWIKKNRLQPAHGGNGHRISVVTGIHGDELEGQYVCWLVQQRIQQHPEWLLGPVDIYPAMNPFGLSSVCRGIPAFDLDMNRIFPGSIDGDMNEYIAA